MSPNVARISPERCDGSPFCPIMRICPRKAVERVPDSSAPYGVSARVDEDACTGCGICLRYCPHRAVSVIPRTREAVSEAGAEA